MSILYFYSTVNIVCSFANSRVMNCIRKIKNKFCYSKYLTTSTVKLMIIRYPQYIIILSAKWCKNQDFS